MSIRSFRLFLILSLLLIVSYPITAQSEWPQWGGPTRNFVVKSTGIASSWPESGPRQLWKRPLGRGHSAIVADRERLYTMYSVGDEEIVIALSPDTGKTIWEHKYAAPIAGMDYEEGYGPHATPLLVGTRVFAVGATGKLYALDKQTGKVLWSHDLWTEYRGQKRDRGYSCSPLAYKDTIILTLGGPGQALVAFKQTDGSVAWKNQTLDMSPTSPILINVSGEDQMVAFMGKQIVGLNPNNGELLWSHGHATDWGLNISLPIWGDDNLLFVSSAYSGGSRVLKVTRTKGKTTVEEVWFNRRFRLHHGTAVRIGDYVYGSSGDFGPAPFTAVNVKTGDIAFQDRTFPKTNFLYVDGRLIILDEDGTLALATVSPTGLKVISRTALMQNLAWTVPTLVGTTLYVRDRQTITAVDLR